MSLTIKIPAGLGYEIFTVAEDDWNSIVDEYEDSFDHTFCTDFGDVTLDLKSLIDSAEILGKLENENSSVQQFIHDITSTEIFDAICNAKSETTDILDSLRSGSAYKAFADLGATEIVANPVSYGRNSISGSFGNNYVTLIVDENEECVLVSNGTVVDDIEIETYSSYETLVRDLARFRVIKDVAVQQDSEAVDTSDIANKVVSN